MDGGGSPAEACHYSLGGREYRMLARFAHRPGHAISFDEISRLVRLKDSSPNRHPFDQIADPEGPRSCPW
jgi:hypothetical protein